MVYGKKKSTGKDFKLKVLSKNIPSLFVVQINFFSLKKKDIKINFSDPNFHGESYTIKQL